MRNDEKSLGAANAIKFYAGVNFPATLYICRFEDDNALGMRSRARCDVMPYLPFCAGFWSSVGDWRPIFLFLQRNLTPLHFFHSKFV